MFCTPVGPAVLWELHWSGSGALWRKFAYKTVCQCRGHHSTLDVLHLSGAAVEMHRGAVGLQLECISMELVVIVSKHSAFSDQNDPFCNHSMV